MDTTPGVRIDAPNTQSTAKESTFAEDFFFCLLRSNSFQNGSPQKQQPTKTNTTLCLSSSRPLTFRSGNTGSLGSLGRFFPFSIVDFLLCCHTTGSGRRALLLYLSTAHISRNFANTCTATARRRRWQAGSGHGELGQNEQENVGERGGNTGVQHRKSRTRTSPPKTQRRFPASSGLKLCLLEARMSTFIFLFPPCSSFSCANTHTQTRCTSFLRWSLRPFV